MANQLTTQDITILKAYADRQERQAYWSYLAAKGDPYAKLALQVVKNDTLDGFTANYYASAIADKAGIQKTSEQWNKVGVDLMRADLGKRDALVEKGQGSDALYLKVAPITESHQAAFAANGLSLDAWTAWAPIKSDYENGNLAGAQDKFSAMVDGGFINTAATVGRGVWGSANWAEAVGQAGVAYALMGADPVNNPNYVKGYSYDARTGNWYAAGSLVAAGGAITASPDLAARLSAERLFRVALTGQGILDANDARALSSQITTAALAGVGNTGYSLPITYSNGATVIIRANGTLSHVVADQNAKGNNISLDELRLFNGLSPSQDSKLQVGQ